jgi:hypothetical protein
MRQAILLLTLLASAAAAAWESSASLPPSPDWVKDLVIYEIATKSFTSPRGPQSGTFESLKQRLPYLQDLGVTGVWLTGHSLSDPRHFYNIWTQYAVIEPDQLDPSLGTPEQFKAMIDEAHRRGIRVFLDVITHGVMPSSSLVKNHPHWFRGGSWGMVDYDWRGGHTDLDDWWVQIWTDYVTRYGVDGFRLDVDIYRPDLWSRIRQNAARAGHPIAIFNEGKAVIPSVTDFTQAENMVSNLLADEMQPIADDVPRFYERRFAPGGEFKVEIRYADDTVAEASTHSDAPLRALVYGYTTDRVTQRTQPPAGESQLHLTVEGISRARIKSVVVKRLDDVGPPRPRRWSDGADDGGAPMRIEGSAPVLHLYLNGINGYGSAVMLSCHDNGWAGFPLDRNPRAAEGSRALFGYSFLFTPMIPMFMAGEEFDADFDPAPTLSPDLYGGRDPGKGRWLYGGQLQWRTIEQPRHRAMLDDVRRMLLIRRQEWGVLAPEIHGEIRPSLVAVSHESDVSIPPPYMRWKGRTAIVVAGNRDPDRDVTLKLNIPVDALGASPDSKFKIRDLWNDKDLGLVSARQLQEWTLTIKRDKTPRGGLALLKIEALDERTS